MRGIVKSFNGKAGWGFIDGEDGRTYFAHHSGIIGQGYRRLFRSEEVDFDVRVIEEDKRWQAVNIIREDRKKAMELACQVTESLSRLPDQVSKIYNSDASCRVKEEAVAIVRSR